MTTVYIERVCLSIMTVKHNGKNGNDTLIAQFQLLIVYNVHEFNVVSLSMS